MTSVSHVGRSAVRRAAPIAVAFVIGLLFFQLTGFGVADVGGGLIEGSVGSRQALEATFRWAVPLFIVALGVLVSFRAGEFNVGGQGQLLVGMLAAVTVGLETSLPAWLTIVLGVVAAVVAGALWSGIAGLLKVAIGADEVIVTLMLNLIAVQLVLWAAAGPLKDPTTSGDAASTPRLDPALRLSDGTGASWSILIIVVLAAVMTWLFIERTATGLRLGYTGANAVAAAWQGMAVGRLRLLSYVVAGGFAGLAGAVEVFGPAGRVVSGSTPTLGFTALIVATVGVLRVGGCVMAALLFGGLQAALLYLPIVSSLPISGIRIIEGLVALLVTARFISRRRVAAREGLDS